MKLVWKFTTNNGVDSWNHVTPFEYSSKDDFCLMVLEMLSEKKSIKDNPFLFFTLFNFEYLSYEDLIDIEKQVFTLEDWFKNNNQTHEL